MYMELTNWWIFKLFENFLLLLNGFWPYSQSRTIAVFMYKLFETIYIIYRSAGLSDILPNPKIGGSVCLNVSHLYSLLKRNRDQGIDLSIVYYVFIPCLPWYIANHHWPSFENVQRRFDRMINDIGNWKFWPFYPKFRLWRGWNQLEICDFFSRTI